VRPRIGELLSQIEHVILGKSGEVRLATACILARGHLLIEDVPGVGKTTLAKTLARSTGLGFRRVQFTSDLLPSDVIGNSIFNRDQGVFVFHPGPIFSPVLLADEVNRATPRTQSALLEAMEENQVSVDGVTHPLPRPFFVIATQNPQTQVGTYPLPESQLDRFLIRIHLGIPDRASEREMLTGRDRRELVENLPSVVDAATLIEAQEEVSMVKSSAALLDYLQDLLAASRRMHSTGLSPRAGLAWLNVAKAWAWMAGRDYMVPEDVQAVGVAVMGHRLASADDLSHNSGNEIAHRVLRETAVP
jgi:MoxR-like ATPase